MLETSYLAFILTTRVSYEKNAQIRSKGFGKVSRDLLLKFWDPLLMSGSVCARNFKFGKQVDHQEY